MARVTIGIPIWNAAAWLPLAIRSVFAQSVADWELYLVDDGSTDASVAIAAAVRDERVHVLADGTHRGLAHRLNEITALGTAPLVARMDADDLMHPERLARQLAEFDRHGQLDLCASLAMAIDERNRPLGLRGMVTPPASALGVFARGLFAHATVMFSREWARRHPYSDRYRRAEDRHLWCSSFRDMRYCVVDEALLYYRDAPWGRLGRYLATNRSVRRIIREVGPRHLGPVAQSVLVCRSHLADSWRRVATLARVGRLLQAGQRAIVPALEVRQCGRIVDQIEHTRVPGLDRAG